MNIEIANDKTLGAVTGHKVVTKILKTTSGGKYLGEVVRIIGHKNDPGVDILSIVYKYDIKTEFNDDTIKQLDTIPIEVSQIDKQGRVDLSKKEIFTIDGDDTKDIDDALSLDILEMVIIY